MYFDFRDRFDFDHVMQEIICRVLDFVPFVDISAIAGYRLRDSCQHVQDLGGGSFREIGFEA